MKVPYMVRLLASRSSPTVAQIFVSLDPRLGNQSHLIAITRRRQG